MPRLTATVLILAALLTGRASAQIVYAPVKFQYDPQNPFFYAGDDPRIFQLATGPIAGAGLFGRVRGYQFVGAYPGRTDVHREVGTYRPQLYTDAIPGHNAFAYGLSVADVRNEANARVPRYFVKQDLIAAAVPSGGVLVVPPTAPTPTGSIYIRPYRPPVLTEPNPVLILPRRLLDRPLKVKPPATPALAGGGLASSNAASEKSETPPPPAKAGVAGGDASKPSAPTT